MTATNRDSYLALFPTTSDAIEFENAALSIGREFLPSAAQTVLDGGEATPCYWTWLIEQVEVQS